MKPVLTITMLLVITCAAAQKSAKDVLDSVAVRALQADGILLKDDERRCTGDCRNIGLWKNDKQRKKALEKDDALKGKLLGKFDIPDFINDQKTSAALTFKNKSIGKAGSYVIAGGKLDVINSGKEPTLPVLVTGDGLSIPAPSDDGSNYTLSFISRQFFEGLSKADFSADAGDYFTTKLTAANNISDDRKTQISIGAGVFTNQLGALYKRANENAARVKDFDALYDLWKAHKAGAIKSTDQVILAFSGMCFFSESGYDSRFSGKYTAEMSSSGKFPFLAYSAEASAKFDQSSKMSVQRNIYNLYMFSAPDLVNIPSTATIIETWNNLSRLCEVSAPSTIVPSNSSLTIQVKFGPLPADPAVFNLVKLKPESIQFTDTDFVKREGLKLVVDPARVKFAGDGYYIFDLEITRNEPFMQNYFQTISDVLKTKLSFSVMIDNPINNVRFEKAYGPIELTTDRLPTAYMEGPQQDFQMLPEKNASRKVFEYKGHVKFNAPANFIVKANPVPPSIDTNIEGLPQGVKTAFTQHLRQGTFVSRGANDFEYSFSIPENSNYFTSTQRSLDIVMILTFTGSNNSSYIRKLPVRLIRPEEEPIIPGSDKPVVIANNTQLIESLNKSAELKDGRKIGDVMNQFTKDGKLDVIGFMEEFKKNTNLNITPEGNYSISSLLIDQSKIKQ